MPYLTHVQKTNLYTRRTTRVALLRSVFVLLFFILQGCGSPNREDYVPVVDSTDTRARDLLAVAEAQGNLSRFVRLVEKADMAGPLRELGPFTVFAPTDAAFARALFVTDTLLSPNTSDSLRSLLEGHIVRGRFRGASFDDSMVVSSLLNTSLTMKHAAGDRAFLVNRVAVLDSLEAQNGILYLVGDIVDRAAPDTARQDVLPPLP